MSNVIEYVLEQARLGNISRSHQRTSKRIFAQPDTAIALRELGIRVNAHSREIHRDSIHEALGDDGYAQFLEQLDNVVKVKRAR